MRNIEGKTPVDIARAMNGSCTVGAVLFLVLIAAGLDPMNETLENPTASGESAAETVVGTEDRFHTGRTAVSLLDDIVSEGNSSTGALPVPGAAERGGMWVIVQEGMLVCSFPPPVESFLFNHKKPDPSKISKRLRFVRRSIIGSYGSDADTGETSPQQGGTGGGGGGGRSTSQQENQGSGVKISKVEVFTSRAEAEERARSFIQADVRAHKSKVTVNGLASSISIPSAGAGMQQQQQQQGLGSPSSAAGGGATSAAAWGSHRRSIGNNSLSSSNPAGDGSFRGGGSSSGGGSISVITAADYKPTTVYHVACIHSERLALFKATVPHYFPLKEAARIPNSPLPHSKNHTPHSFNNYNKNINEDLEDPMWASFKRSHSSNALKTSNYYGGGGIYSDTSDTSSAFQDTSRSNKPVKLLPAPPSQRIAALTDLSSNPSGSHGEGSTAERGAQQEMTATLGGSGNSSAVAADVNSALPTTQSSSKPPPRSISKKQLVEEEMELTTSIAAANAQVTFPRLSIQIYDPKFSCH